MALFLISRVFVLAENDFNQIKENFLNSQKETDASGSPDQAITCTCPFTSFSQVLSSQPGTCSYLQERAVKSFIL